MQFTWMLFVGHPTYTSKYGKFTRVIFRISLVNIMGYLNFWVKCWF